MNRRSTVKDHSEVRDPTDCDICGEVIEAGDAVAGITVGAAVYKRGFKAATTDSFTLKAGTSTPDLYHKRCLYEEMGLGDLL